MTGLARCWLKARMRYLPHCSGLSYPYDSCFLTPMARQPGKRGRRDTTGMDFQMGAQGSDSNQMTLIKLVSPHEATIEKLKSSTVVMLYLPKDLHDKVEEAAAEWMKKSKKGEAHPDSISCTTARIRALCAAVTASIEKRGVVLG